MIENLKYIVVDVDGGLLSVIFTPLVEHVTIARKLGYKVVGAGFVSISPNPSSPDRVLVALHGESKSLKKGIGEDDWALIDRAVNQGR